MNKKFFTLSIILLTTFLINAQKLTISPFSKFGIGEILNQSNSRQYAMGGTSIADYNSFEVSKVNPASSSAFFPKRALFEFHFFNRLSYFQYDNQSQFNDVANIFQIMAGFRVAKWYSTTFGLAPYSGMGYTIVKYDTLIVENYKQPILIDYSGNGTINQLFWGNSFTFFKRFTLGANINYNFGYISKFQILYISDSITESNTEFEKRASYNKITYDLGFLYNDTIKKDSKPFIRYSVGGIFSNKTNFDAIHTKYVWRATNTYNQSLADSIFFDTTGISSFSIPLTYGLGVSVTFKDKLTINVDYISQQWHNCNVWADNNFANSTYIAIGSEYCSDPYSSNYFKTISYRFGFYNKDSYAFYNGKQINTKAITLGFMLPFKSINFNLSFQFGKTSNLNSGLKENFTQLNVGLNLIDIWFLKRLYN